MPLVRALFSAEVVPHIQVVHVRQHRLARDKPIWNLSKSGIYSIKKGYHMSMKEIRCMDLRRKKLWNRLWNMKVPYKIIVFLWRAVTGALATVVNLKKRKVMQYSVCSTCQLREENEVHLLLTCRESRKMWTDANLGKAIDNRAQTWMCNFGCLEKWMDETRSSEEFIKSIFCFEKFGCRYVKKQWRTSIQIQWETLYWLCRSSP